MLSRPNSKKHLKNELEPRQEQTKAGMRTAFFADAAHFVQGTYHGYLWFFDRGLVRSPSGRQRFSVLSALHAITHQQVNMIIDSYIIATSACELLEKFALLGLQEPITLVMVNARYQCFRLMLERAAHLGIEVLFLPTSCPNLNLIERWWKFVRNECLYAKYYENFELFKHALQHCLSKPFNLKTPCFQLWG